MEGVKISNQWSNEYHPWYNNNVKRSYPEHTRKGQLLQTALRAATATRQLSHPGPVKAYRVAFYLSSCFDNTATSMPKAISSEDT